MARNDLQGSLDLLVLKTLSQIVPVGTTGTYPEAISEHFHLNIFAI
jgi:hypothetical protein